MVLPSMGTKKDKNENSQSCFCFGSFRNCSTNEHYNRSFTKMKRMKMINNSHQYYTIALFQCLGNCAIIHDVTKLFLFDNSCLFWVCWKRWTRFFTITLFQCLGNCAIIRDVTKLFCLIIILCFWVCWKRWTRFFYA